MAFLFENLSVTSESGLGRMYAEIAAAIGRNLSNRKNYTAIMHRRINKQYIYIIFTWYLHHINIWDISCKCNNVIN